MEDWPDFPVIQGQGSIYDLCDAEKGPSRLYGMKSVSQAAAEALRRRPKAEAPRQIGFQFKRVR